MINFKRVNKELAEYKAVENLYLTAFPREERPPFELLLRETPGGQTDFWSLYEEDEWIGFVQLVTVDGVAYVFFFAIDEKKRGMGHGSAVIAALRDKYHDRRLFLALEPLDENAPNYQQRVSRRHFYEKNGLKGMDFKISECGIVFDSMCFTEEIKPEDYMHLMEVYMGAENMKKLDIKAWV